MGLLDALRGDPGDDHVGLFVDGPNVLREE